MKRLAAICLVLLAFAETALAQSPEILVIGSSPRAAVTPDELHKGSKRCTEFDPLVPNTYALQTAKDNAELLQEAGQLMAARGKALVIPPGKFYAVADHNDDGYDIWWEGVSGLAVHMAGATVKQVPGDENANFPNAAEGGLIHVDDESSTYHLLDGSTKTLSTSGASATVTVSPPGTVQASDAGAMVRIFAGTNFLRDFYEIESVNAAANTWTLDRPCSTGVGAAATGWMRTRKSVIGLCNIRTCNMSLNVRGGNEFVTGDDPGEAGYKLTNGVTAFDGIRLLHKTGQSPSGKSSFAISATQCQRAIDIDSVGVPQGPDNLEFSTIFCPDCMHGMYVNTPQAVDIVVEKIWNGGNTCDALFDFSKGGDLLCRYAYAPAGRILRVRDTVTDNQADFTIQKIKVDQEIMPAVTIVDCEDDDGPVRIRIGGALSSPPTHQMVRLAASKTGFTDCQLDIHNLGDEEGAYPVRPTRGQWVPKRVRPPRFSTTSFFFDADDYNANEDDWDVDENTLIITEAPDISGSANVLAGVNNTMIVRGEVNHRAGVLINTDDRLVDASPTGINAAYGDRTIALVVKPTAVSGASNRIFGCTNEDNTSGFKVNIDNIYRVVVAFGTDVYTSNGTLEVNRPNTIFITRTASTGQVRICVNGGLMEIPPAGASGTIAATTSGSVHLGMRQMGAAAWDTPFEGYISQAIVNEDDLIDVALDGSTITATTDEDGETLSVTAGTVQSSHVGQTLFITGGTGFTPGVYKIESTGSNTWTIDRDCTSASSATGLVGVLMDDNYTTLRRYVRQFGAW